MPKIMLALAMVLVIAVLSPSFSGLTGAKDVEATVTVVRSGIIQRLTLTGTLSAGRRSVLISSPGTSVRSVFAKRGAFVAAGERLFELDVTPLERDVLRHEIALLRATTSRMEEASGDDRLRALEIKLAQAELDHAKSRLLGAIVRAPFDGVIVQAAIPEEGMAPNAPVVVLVDPKTLQVDLELDEFDIVGITPGTRALVYFDALVQPPLTAVVKDAPSLRRPRSAGVPATFACAVTLDGAELDVLQFGMSARVEIERARRDDVLAVPLRAIVRHQDVDYVVTIEEGVERAQPVKLGVSDDTIVELMSGPREGTHVVSEDADKLRQRLQRTLGASE